jgi:hypothetical protein
MPMQVDYTAILEKSVGVYCSIKRNIKNQSVGAIALDTLELTVSKSLLVRRVRLGREKLKIKIGF